MMRRTLNESDIGKTFGIYNNDDEFMIRKSLDETLFGNDYIGDGIFESIEPFALDDAEIINIYCFTNFVFLHEDEKEEYMEDNYPSPEGRFEVVNKIFVERKKINPKLKEELQRRIYTRKNGRRVNELSKLPLSVRQNIFTYLTKEKVPSPSKKRGGTFRNKSGKKRRQTKIKKRR